jgi:peptide/nickel transport system substrate-binding protein
MFAYILSKKNLEIIYNYIFAIPVFRAKNSFRLMKFKAFLKANAIIPALLLFTASSCGGDKPKSGDKKNNWKTDNTVVYHVIGDVDEMHPTNGTSAQRQEIMLYTQVFLIQTNYPNPSEPYLYFAKSGPVISEDGLNYSYELRTDLKFDDGSPITAEDLVFTYKANKCQLVNNPHAKPYLDHLKTIIVDPTDKNKVTLVMKDRYIQNLWFVTDYPIMQRKFFDPDNVLSKYPFEQLDDKNFIGDKNKDLKDWATSFNDPKFSNNIEFLAGAGPYKIEKWDRGQSITLVKKKNHWTAARGGLYEDAYPDKIIMKISKDPTATKLEFKKQVYDASAYLDIKTLAELQADDEFNKNYSSEFTPTYNFNYIGMNLKPDNRHKKFFTDKLVRRAMALLVPRDDINLIVNKNKYKKIIGPVHPSKPEYNSELKLIEYNVEEAKKLLAQAGWKDTDGDNILDKVIDGEKVQFQFKLNYMTTTTSWADMAKLTAESMLKAGVKAELNPLEFGVQIESCKNHDFDMYIAAWASASVPEDFTQIWHTSSWASKGSNYVGFGNSETDALIDSIKYAIEDSKRIPMVKRLQAIIYEEQPYVFLYAQMRRIAIHNRFDNREMYAEKPGLLLNRLKLNTGSAKPSAE